MLKPYKKDVEYIKKALEPRGQIPQYWIYLELINVAERSIKVIQELYYTSLNPQSLRDIIKKVAKISINQLLIKLTVK